MDGIEPLVEGKTGRLEDRAHRHRELFPAATAVVEPGADGPLPPSSVGSASSRRASLSRTRQAMSYALNELERDGKVERVAAIDGRARFSWQAKELVPRPRRPS